MPAIVAYDVVVPEADMVPVFEMLLPMNDWFTYLSLGGAPVYASVRLESLVQLTDPSEAGDVPSVCANAPAQK